MLNLYSLLQKAKSSKLSLWFLNLIVKKIVPFNKPHHVKIKTVGVDYVETIIPYRKKNLNHVKGIHACAIATVGEFAAGLAIMSQFSPLDYRVILSRLEIDYFYQAKKDLIAKAVLNNAEKSIILETLLTDEKTLQIMTTEITDINAQKIATVKSTWQIKDWKKVKTQV